MKIVILDSDTVAYNNDVDLDVFRGLGDVCINKFAEPEKTVELIKGADAVLCNKTVIDADAMASSPNLKYIGLFATGYNNVDIKCADEKGITVCNAGSYSTDAVAQHTFALILDRFSKVSEYNSLVLNGDWVKSRVFSPFVLCTQELCGKTIGIIGYGSIGKAVAEIALAFKMKVKVFNRSKKEDERVEFCSLDELLKSSDIVTVHCPLNEQSKNMFCKKTFDMMKNGAFFVNTARGPIVNEKDLAEVLKSGKITAAVDVLEYEPMKADCPLLGAKGITVTPHVAWAPLTTRQRLLKIVYDNLDMYIKGNPSNVVNNPCK